MTEIKSLEPQVPKEVEGRIIKGVAAVILSQDGKILVVQETENRPEVDKQSGDWSIPGETIEKGETEFEALSWGSSRRMLSRL
jgi:8-oxo-dGTP pyrophosphatase MutT (NUDIX family)